MIELYEEILYYRPVISSFPLLIRALVYKNSAKIIKYNFTNHLQLWRYIRTKNYKMVYKIILLHKIFNKKALKIIKEEIRRSKSSY